MKQKVILNRRHLLAIAILPLSQLVYAQSPGAALKPTTGVTGSAWREVWIPVDASATSSARRKAQSSSGPSGVLLLQIDNPSGLAAAPLQQSVREQLRADSFVGSESIYVDKAIADSMADGTVQAKYGASAIPDTSVDSSGNVITKSLSLGCSTDWRDVTYTKTVPLDGVDKEIYQNGAVSLSLGGRFSGQADVTVKIQYKKNFLCIPYAVRFVSASAKGAVNLNDSTLSLTTATSVKSEETLGKSNLYEYWGYTWIGFIPVRYGFMVPLEYGYKTIVNAAATVSTTTTLKGAVPFDYRCSGGSCTGTHDTSKVEYLAATPALNASIQVDATVDPFLLISAQGSLYAEQLSKASIGLKFSTPLMYYAYYGNACGDGDGDGVNELLNTQFVDLQARVSLTTAWALLGSERRNYVSWDGWAGRRVNGALYSILHSEGDHKPLWAKGLYFYEKSAGNSIFSPLTRYRSYANTPSRGSYMHYVDLTMRPCTPFQADYFAEVYEKSAGTQTVIIPRNGTGSLAIPSKSPAILTTVKTLTDGDGRNFTAAPASNTASPPKSTCTPGTRACSAEP